MRPLASRRAAAPWTRAQLEGWAGYQPGANVVQWAAQTHCARSWGPVLAWLPLLALAGLGILLAIIARRRGALDLLVIGVLGMGSWNSKTSPGAKAYFDAHVKKFGAGKEPDRWASGATWAGLEILTAAVAKVGLDKKAVRDYVAATTHKTIIGDIRFTGSENTATPGTLALF